MNLVPIDPKNEASVLTLLERAATWLAEAVHRGEPGEVAMVKAQLATAAEATKQLNLSKEIQLDAQEMVRRAEYALGKAIRRGQAEGVIATKSEMASYAGRVSAGRRLGQCQPLDRPTKPSDFATESELMGARGDGIYALADNADPEQFDAALDEARIEGNVSRANVVRKIKKQSGPITRDQRADLIEKLAAQGYSSRQMPIKVGVTEETIRQIARDYDIEIPADRAVSRARRHDSHRIATETVATLEGLAIGVGLINYSELDPREARQWADSLNDSLRVLNRFAKQIKETTHA